MIEMINRIFLYIYFLSARISIWKVSLSRVQPLISIDFFSFFVDVYRHTSADESTKYRGVLCDRVISPRSAPMLLRINTFFFWLSISDSNFVMIRSPRSHLIHERHHNQPNRHTTKHLNTLCLKRIAIQWAVISHERASLYKEKGGQKEVENVNLLLSVITFFAFMKILSCRNGIVGIPSSFFSWNWDGLS